MTVLLLFLAAVGLTQLMVLLFGWIFSGGEKEYLLQRGDAAGLEYRLRSAKTKGYISVLLEDGLDEEARFIASRFPDVIICRSEELSGLFKERNGFDHEERICHGGRHRGERNL